MTSYVTLGEEIDPSLARRADPKAGTRHYHFTKEVFDHISVIRLSCSNRKAPLFIFHTVKLVL